MSDLVANFTQNSHCYTAMETTREMLLVPSSHFNKFQGTGVDINGPGLANPQLWKGDNIKGDILGNIRKELVR